VTSNISRIKEIIGIRNKRTFIVQKYVDKPMLFKNRKFDIRCYILLT